MLDSLHFVKKGQLVWIRLGRPTLQRATGNSRSAWAIIREGLAEQQKFLLWSTKRKYGLVFFPAFHLCPVNKNACCFVIENLLHAWHTLSWKVRWKLFSAWLLLVRWLYGLLSIKKTRRLFGFCYMGFAFTWKRKKKAVLNTLFCCRWLQRRKTGFIEEIGAFNLWLPFPIIGLRTVTLGKEIFLGLLFSGLQK